MQIYELTQAKQEQLDEIDIIGGIKGAVSGFQQSQQQRQVQQNTAALSKSAQQQWNNKVIQLTQAAGGQPVDPADYESNLRDFVERTMLRSYKIDSMEPQSQGRLDQAIKAVVQSRNDRRTLGPVFEKMVQQALVARLDPAKTASRGAGIAQTGTGTFVNTRVPGLQIAPATQQSPQTLVRFKNETYRLDDRNQWLDRQDRPATETMSALLTLAAQSI